jgi:hypothetical protein
MIWWELRQFSPNRSFGSQAESQGFLSKPVRKRLPEETHVQVARYLR